MPFREIQRFSDNLAARVIVTGVSLLLVGAAVWTLSIGSMQALAFVITAFYVLVALSLMALLHYAHLVIEVDETHLRFRFPPTRGQVIAPDDIVSAEPRDYRPIREFGGWGLRGNLRGTRVYSVSGTRAVVLRLTDGREFLVGSRRADELALAIDLLRRRV